MDLVEVREVISPRREEEIPSWTPGDAYVAGGTWLFSEPQPEIRRLIDLSKLPGQEISRTDEELIIPAGVTYSALHQSAVLLGDASQLFLQAVRTLSSSFKTWGLATIGGNLCLAYAKSMMAPTLCLLDARYDLLTPGSRGRSVEAREFQTGVCQTIRAPGEYLRQVRIPLGRLEGRFALEKESYTTTSHATAMVLTRMPHRGSEEKASVTISAATVRPVSFELPRQSTTGELLAGVEAAVEGVEFLETGHGGAAYRREMVAYLAARAWDRVREAE